MSQDARYFLFKGDVVEKTCHGVTVGHVHCMINLPVLAPLCLKKHEKENRAGQNKDKKKGAGTKEKQVFLYEGADRLIHIHVPFHKIFEHRCGECVN